MKIIKFIPMTIFIWALVGCESNPLIGFDSGEKGTYFKRLSIRCVAGKSPLVDLDSVSLSLEQVQPGSVLTHIITIERCVNDEERTASGPAIKVTRQIVVGVETAATNTEDLSSQINRNGLWEVRTQINIGKNPPGRYAIRTTVYAGGRKLVRINPFTVVR